MKQFRQVCLGWIFKLHSLHDLKILTQHERINAAVPQNGERLSMLWWDISEVSELLRCAFFRPIEMELWQFAKRWCLEGAGAAAFAARTPSPSPVPPRNDSAMDSSARGTPPPLEEVERQESFNSRATPLSQARKADPSSAAAQDINAAISEALLWELLPPREELAFGRQAEAPSSTAGDQGASAEPAETTRDASSPQRVLGSSFFHVSRRADCELREFDKRDAFHMRRLEDSTTLHCWNAASETEVIGSTRQVLASTLAMIPGSGQYRFDLRVNSGTSSEAAHLLEVGLMSDPHAGVCFDAGSPSVRRPLKPGEEGKGEPFFRLVTIFDTLLEGVRLAVELDMDEATVTIRNLPSSQDDAEDGPPTSLSAWFDARNRALVMAVRNPGELDCPLFKEHVEHLNDLIDRGTLEGELADTVLADDGVKWVLANNIVPDTPEAYHFYVSIPAGLEVEIF